MAVGLSAPYVSDTIAHVGTGMVAPVYTDVAAQLDSGQSVNAASVTAVLTERNTGAVVTGALTSPPTVSGTKLVQVVTGSALTAGHSYWLTFTYAPTPPDVTGEQMPALQPITCDY